MFESVSLTLPFTLCTLCLNITAPFKIYIHVYKSAPFVANNDVCRLLITFANNLDPGQDRQNVSAQFYFY